MLCISHNRTYFSKLKASGRREKEGRDVQEAVALLIIIHGCRKSRSISVNRWDDSTSLSVRDKIDWGNYLNIPYTTFKALTSSSRIPVQIGRLTRRVIYIFTCQSRTNC
ncbi:hypothetical protein RRG08_021718 [Elysia crispata]|uniref:Uncharacterized protein n=1 Tax=Elysia crispata TaxID=231223 RepID=A0AAE1DNT2_9GAST|nr:hypothetical protein RRG08_021718 [Elysia crispata]